MFAARHKRQSITAILPGFLDVAANDITTWLRIAQPFRLTGAVVHLVAKTAPASHAVVVAFLRSSDDGATFGSLSGALTLGIGSKIATITPTWAATALKAGDILRLDLTTADGSCANMTVQIDEA